MKTVKKIQTEIFNAKKKIVELESGKTHKGYKEAARIRAQMSDLQLCEKYLQTEPREDYLKSEVLRLETKITNTMKLYTPLDAERFTKSQCTAHRALFRKQYNLPHIEKQLEILSYILK